MRRHSGYAKVVPWNRRRLPVPTDRDQRCRPLQRGRLLATQERHMSFVKTQPAAIAAAATQIEGIANSFAAESSAAASSTTDVLPAAADEVSGLQAGVFSTYGQLYQSVSAQAQAIHQQFVQLLNQSSGSYQDTETANQAGAAANALSNASGSASSAASSASPIETLTNLISGLT